MYGYVRRGNSQPAWLFPFVVAVVLLLRVLRFGAVQLGTFAQDRGQAFDHRAGNRLPPLPGADTIDDRGATAGRPR